MIAQILDHLWQSTAFLCLVGLLTLLLRRNSARARYWLWLAASLKFLLPLSPLTSLTKGLSSLSAIPVLSAAPSGLAQRIYQPFAHASTLPAVSVAAPAAAPSANLPAVLLIIWGVGMAVVLLSWFVRWRRVRRALSSARSLPVAAPIPVRESLVLMEPGLVGIWSPVILLPAGLTERLTPEEVDGILAHELCHYRRCDNLTATIHMLVEALLWFYPPVWWLGARLMAERERACDESVLAAGNDAEVYAGSILKVCRFFAQSKIACAAGVSGSDLRRRVEEIMSGRCTFPVGPTKKLLVTVSIAGALCAMVLCGGLSVPVARAQASGSALPAPADHAKLLAEQQQPQKEVPFNPTDFDKFVGYYRFGPSDAPLAFAHVYREGDHYYTQLTAQPPVEEFPESPTEFFATVVAAQISFVTGPDGRVSGMVLHQNGYLRPWPRSSKSANDAFESKLQQRIKDNRPSPGSEAAVQRQIQSLESTSHQLYAEMTPQLAAAARAQDPQHTAMWKRLGALHSLRFDSVLPNGNSEYLATFAHGDLVVIIAPLTPDGKISGLLYRMP
jgi:beta-lactamase regulating signal transducer with metallopeptidase domain